MNRLPTAFIIAVTLLCGSRQLFAGNLVEVVVNAALYPRITSSIAQYQKDLIQEGYQVEVALWSTPGSTPQQLKLFLRSKMASGLQGAFLVGDLPIAPAYCAMDYDGSPSVYPCDLFFMDVDNDNWRDSNGDGTYDQHLRGSIQPKIWVGRLVAGNLPVMGAETAIISNYFVKNHAYRTGTAPLLSNDALSVKASLTNASTGLRAPDPTATFSMDQAYNSYFNMTDPYPTNTTFTQYLQQGHASLVIAADSTPLLHYLWNAVTNYYDAVFNSSDLPGIAPKAWFYNIFGCRAVNFTVTNNLGGCYLAGTASGLAVVGSTKYGSMGNAQKYYQALGRNQSIGQAFLYWFQEYGIVPLPDMSEFKAFSGMVLLGDPTLKLYVIGTPDPVLVGVSVGGAPKINIVWAPRREKELIGYNVYSIAPSGNPATPVTVTKIASQITGTSFTVTPETANISYYVTAVNRVTITAQNYTFSNESYPTGLIGQYSPPATPLTLPITPPIIQPNLPTLPPTGKGRIDVRPPDSLLGTNTGSNAEPQVRDLTDVRAYPNPFTPALHPAGITLKNIPSDTRIKIYTISGELVNDIDGTGNTGSIAWNGRNASGEDVASGIYFAVLSSASDHKVIKLAIIK